MSFIQTDEYDDFEPVKTRDRLIEREQFTFTDGSPVIPDPDGIICHEEAVDMKLNSLIASTTRHAPSGEIQCWKCGKRGASGDPDHPLCPACFEIHFNAEISHHSGDIDRDGILRDIQKKAAVFAVLIFLAGALLGGSVIAHYDQQIVDSYSQEAK